MIGLRARNLLFLTLVASFSALASACSFVPTAEIKVFKESVNTANAAATPILDELSSTLRSEKRRTTIGREQVDYRRGASVQFRPGDADLFSDIGDPSQVAIFRRAHNILDRLADVLLSLALGIGAEADAGAVEGLASAFLDLAAAIPGANLEAAAAQGGLAALQPALIQLSKELSRREARRVIEEIQSKKIVDKLVTSLIEATPAMFSNLVLSAKLRAVTAPSKETASAYEVRVTRMRLVMSNYVVLLQRSNDAWAEAAKAARSQSSGDVVVLTERVAELKAAAMATRKAYADMNAAQ